MYCGTDIIEVNRIKEAIENTKGFKENIYTQNEVKEIDSIKSDIKYQRYAGRFAAKEAIYKAMSKILIKNKVSMSFLDVEVLNIQELSRRPKVIFLKKEIIDLVQKEKIDIDISISHIEKFAIANAIVTKGGKVEK